MGDSVAKIFTVYSTYTNLKNGQMVSTDPNLKQCENEIILYSEAASAVSPCFHVWKRKGLFSDRSRACYQTKVPSGPGSQGEGKAEQMADQKFGSGWCSFDFKDFSVPGSVCRWWNMMIVGLRHTQRNTGSPEEKAKVTEFRKETDHLYPNWNPYASTLRKCRWCSTVEWEWVWAPPSWRACYIAPIREEKDELFCCFHLTLLHSKELCGCKLQRWPVLLRLSKLHFNPTIFL